MLLTTTFVYALPILNDPDGAGVTDPVDTFTNGDSYAWYTNSGKFLFTNSGNDSGAHLGNVELAIEEYFDWDATTFTLISTSAVTYTNYDDSGAVVTGASKSGTWETTNSSTTIEFYSVKAGSGYALYQLNPVDNYGSWSTFDLWSAGSYGGGNGGLEISHFSGFQPSAPVPEPATIILFGLGLLGLAGVSRKK